MHETPARKYEGEKMREAGREEKLSERLSHGAPLAAIILVVSGISLLLIYELRPILELIAVAMLLSLVLRTIVRGLDRARFPIWLSVIVLLVILGSLGALIWLVMIPRLLAELQQLTSSGFGSIESVAKLFQHLPLVPDTSKLSGNLHNYASSMVGSLPTILYSAGEALLALVAVVFLALYFAAKPSNYISGILRMVPRERRPGVEDFIKRIGTRLRGWIVGVGLVATFIGVGAGLGLWLLGIPLPLTFGLIAGVLNVIPFAGSIVGGTLPVLLALTISPTKAIEVFILYLVLNQVESHILQPQIMGRQVKVGTAMVIVAFLMLGALLGPIIGAFLAVPATVVVSVILDEIAEKEPSLGFEKDKKQEAPKKKEVEA
ncbi:MAG: AI-2E family transporter [Rubrobacteraceae bacterium]